MTPISTTIGSTINLVKANKRSKHNVTISFDEWNVWYHSMAGDREVLDGHAGWPFAPPILEDIYNFEDILQVGCILNTFIRRSDVVKIACIAQLVNVIAPIMTNPKGGAWRQTIFYPYYFASVFGRGTALNLAVKCAGYDAEVADNVPFIDISGVHNEAEGTVTFFAVNRHATESAGCGDRAERIWQGVHHRPSGHHPFLAGRGEHGERPEQCRAEEGQRRND